jgi:hypothetical protein
MEQIEFPQDFSGFLKLPNAHHVKYLLIGVSLLRFTDNPVPPPLWTFGSRGIVPTPSGLSLASH